MNKKRLLKSIIGSIAIYGILLLLLLLFQNIDIGLGLYFLVLVVTLAACSIAARLLFKGELYAAVWSAATLIFCAVINIIPNGLSGWDFVSFMGVLLFYIAPLLIPFFIIKGLRWSWNNTN